MSINIDKNRKMMEFGPVNKITFEGQWFFTILIVFIILLLLMAAGVMYTVFEWREYKKEVAYTLNTKLANTQTNVGSNITMLEQRMTSLEKIVEPLSLLDPEFAVERAVSRINDEIWRINEERFHVVESKIGSMTDELLKARERLESGDKREILYIALINLMQAVKSAMPYETELATVKFAAEENAEILHNLSVLKTNAASGIPTIEELRNKFTLIASQVLKQQKFAQEPENFYDRITQRVSESFIIRKTGIVSGADPEAVIARAEYYIKENNIDKALSELEELKDMRSGELKVWVNQANAYKQQKMAFNNILRYLSENSLKKIQAKENKKQTAGENRNVILSGDSQNTGESFE